jgi:hypothetical protein
MLDLEIIECYVFCLLQLDKNVDAFMQNNYHVIACYLTKCILLESRASIYPYADKSYGVPFVLMVLSIS